MSYTENKKVKSEQKAHSTIKKVIRPKQDEISVRLKLEEPEIRYLKLYPFYRESKSKLLHKPQGKVVPELRLCGNWLEDAGFYPNDYVSVTVMDELLIIRSMEELDDEKNE